MNSNTNFSLSRLILGWCLALVYWFSLHGIGPATLGMVAWLDSSHQVKVEACGESFDLVLHHPGSARGHVHGLLTTLVTGISVHDGDHDHVLHFSAASDAASFRDEALTIPPQLILATPWEYQPLPSVIWPEKLGPNPYAARPPPGKLATLRCLRTTVLLV